MVSELSWDLAYCVALGHPKGLPIQKWGKLTTTSQQNNQNFLFLIQDQNKLITTSGLTIVDWSEEGSGISGSCW